MYNICFAAVRLVNLFSFTAQKKKKKKKEQLYIFFKCGGGRGGGGGGGVRHAFSQNLYTLFSKRKMTVIANLTLVIMHLIKMTHRVRLERVKEGTVGRVIDFVSEQTTDIYLFIYLFYSKRFSDLCVYIFY